MFVVKKQQMVPGAHTHALYPPRYSFSQRVTCGNEMARNQPKHEFWTKRSGFGMFAGKKQEMVLGAQTHALYPPRYAFSQWVSAATKWRETTLNMRFGPKEVDWACSL